MTDPTESGATRNIKSVHEPGRTYPDPTPEMLASPQFEVVWQAIKRWDLSRDNNGLYSGASGTDVRIILDALKPFFNAYDDNVRIIKGLVKALQFI